MCEEKACFQIISNLKEGYGFELSVNLDTAPVFLVLCMECHIQQGRWIVNAFERRENKKIHCISNV